ncbi:hypothetical protein Tco_0706162 [Tanacetum coccineum]|uniref:Uncharacterized protein n=1 Tax=Tanacetum coccineum TaxID=301880 RepID=A0ABQ4Y878_9ASTR
MVSFSNHLKDDTSLGDNNLVMFTYFRIPGMSLDDCLVPLMVAANVIKIIELYLWYNVVSSSGKDSRLLEWPEDEHIDTSNHPSISNVCLVFEPTNDVNVGYLDCKNETPGDIHEKFQHAGDIHKIVQEIFMEMMICSNKIVMSTTNRILIIQFMRYIERKKDTRKFLIRSIEEGLYKMKQIPATNTTVTRLQTEDDLTGDDLKHYKADIEAIDIDFSTTE